MPTVRPRHMITETPDVEQALDVAERRWPGVPRGQLLKRLIREGAESVRGATDSLLEDRMARILAAAGGFDDCFNPALREELREDWPA